MSAVQTILYAAPDRQIVRVQLSTPPIGGKCWLLDAKGTFILEDGPGVLRTIACTHAGAGSIEAIDGTPDDQGFFPDEGMKEPHRAEFGSAEAFTEAMQKFCTRNGRPVYRANPVVMGSWFLDAGFEHGLVLRAEGGHVAVNLIASVVFSPFRKRGPQ